MKPPQPQKYSPARETLTAELLTGIDTDTDTTVATPTLPLTDDKRQVRRLTIECQQAEEIPIPADSLSPEYLTQSGNMSPARARPRSIMEDGKVALVTVGRAVPEAKGTKAHQGSPK